MAIINNNFELDYIPARICDGKELLIKYYYWDIKEAKRRRKVMRFNHLIGKFPKREIIKMMNKACADINMKLEAGKNPDVEAEMPKAYTKLKDAITIFSTIKEQEMREDGFNSYKSYIKRLLTWLASKGMADCFVVAFNKDMAVECLTNLELDPKIGNRTYNNYMVFYKSLWYWLIEKNYCKVNVFTGFKKKEEEEKIRKVIETDTQAKIVEYCREFNPRFEIVIDLVRAAFIRPAEICRIQIENIDLVNKVISIPKGKAKAKKFRYAYLPEWLCVKIMNNYQLERYPLDYYFITRDLSPGTKKTGTKELDKIWEKLRNKLELGKEAQLYSYRDTGITALEDSGIPRRVIIKLTGHKTEKMAGRYIGQPNKELIDNVVSKISE